MIQLTEANLTAFGKFHNRKISFTDGFQVIYGGNEAGKSTLQLFIKAMLYGIPNQRKTGTLVLKDRERIIPWGQKYAEGVLSLSVDGTQIEIYRRFGKTSATDKTEIRDAITGEPLAGYQGETLGEQLLGISAELFEKTFWIRQDSAFPIGTDEELAKKLRNLQESGEEEVSAKDTLERLQQQKKSLRAKDKRGTPGLLDILFQKKEEKIKERFMLESEREQRKSAETRRKAAEQRLGDAEERIRQLQQLEETKKRLETGQTKAAKWKEAERLQTLIHQMEESKDFQKFSALTDETLQKAESIKRKIETLDRNQQIRYDKEEIISSMETQRRRKQLGTAGIIFGIFVLLVALVLGVFRVPFWNTILIATIPVCGCLLGIGFFFCHQAGKMLASLRVKQEEFEKTDAQAVSQLTAYKMELSGILEAFRCETVEELQNGFSLARAMQIERESYQNAYQKLLENENPEELRQASLEHLSLSDEEKELLASDLTEQVQKLQTIRMEAVSEMKELEGKLSYVYHEGKSPADAEAELLLLEEDIDAAKERLAAIELAESVFASVCEKRRTEFAPQVNEKVNHYLSVLSSGSYQDVRVSDSYRMRIGIPGGDTAEAEYFSRGTYEQMYLALRLSLGDFIGSGEEPLFFDDILSSFDDTRMRQAVTLLQQLGQRRQIVLFTCHTRVKELGGELLAEIYDL